MNEEECISWLEKEITKEDVRVNNEETKQEFVDGFYQLLKI